MHTVAQTENSEKHLNMAAKFEYLREICIFYGKFENLPKKYFEIWPKNRKFAIGKLEICWEIWKNTIITRYIHQ